MAVDQKRTIKDARSIAQARSGNFELNQRLLRGPEAEHAVIFLRGQAAFVAGTVDPTTGVVTALYDRKNTGKGQKVDVAMLDSQVAAKQAETTITRRAPRAPSSAAAVESDEIGCTER